MTAITDFFGKASVDEDYAIATTVDATRTAGDSVLEAVDLSKFTDDTPVFFVTYKKTTNPSTGEVEIEDLVSYKALVNVGANTLTNIVVAPGYTDLGNDIGDFIECIPTSYWVNSLMNGIFVGHNPDGTFKADALRSALGIVPGSFAGWENLGATVGSVTPKGNNSFEVTLNGFDARPVLTEGMRVRTTRTVPASDTSFSLDGVNDYYVKNSPNKMGWTDDFAAGFWIYPTAYPTVFSTIASRYNGTSGWELLMDSRGSILMIGHNGGASNFRAVTSHQSVPLNEWTFVAAQLDMSAYTLTPTTNYIMIGGTDVPAYVSQGGTNPTAIIAAGNFEIGSTNGGTNLFTGYIGDGGVFSAKITQAAMLAFMNQKPTGSETNIASAYANGSVNDLNTTTPNNLVATNGATTVNNAPYGNRGASTSLDFGVIMTKPAYGSGNSTFILQVPEGCTLPVSGGISSIDFSGVDTPFGFPKDKSRWTISTIKRGDDQQSSPAASTWYNPNNTKLIVPAGAWELSMAFVLYGFKSGSNNFNVGSALSRSLSAITDQKLSAYTFGAMDPTNNAVAAPVKRSTKVSLATATPFYLNFRTETASANAMGTTVGGAQAYNPTILEASNAYV